MYCSHSLLSLLEGASQFHIILETLDIEEASYLWHLPKVRSDLPLMLKAIDGHLDILRKRDRQEFLTSAPENFSRIIHDYTDSQKGFIDIKTATPEAIGMADSFAQKTPCSNP